MTMFDVLSCGGRRTKSHKLEEGKKKKKEKEGGSSLGVGTERNETVKSKRFVTDEPKNTTTPTWLDTNRTLERKKKGVHPSSKDVPSNVDATMLSEKKVRVMHSIPMECQTSPHRERDTKRRIIHIHVRGKMADKT